jgi:thiosulfate/3-mercaptopyruvate sulfurtransferase
MSLITPEDLLARSDDPRLRLLDVRWWLTDLPRGRRDYEAGHIPGAAWVDLDTVLTAPSGPGRHPLPSPADFAAAMRSLGITDDACVVVYDDVGGTIAARLWWMLDSLGHRDVHLLDGGFQAWVAAGGPVSTVEPAPEPAAADQLQLATAWAGVVDRAWMVDHLGADGVTVVDVRAPERYRGDTEPVDPVPGHIPTAVNRPLPGNLDAAGRFRTSDELRARFEGLGPTVVHACGSGVNACHSILAAHVAGLPDPLLYEGSYSDWSRSGMPIATGEDPGSWPPADVESERGAGAS